MSDTSPPDARAPWSEDAIYAEIRSAVGEHKLPPGTRLREDEMRQVFSVSRARIRKVFARLAYDGLIDLAPNRGASVAKPSPDEARALFAARRAIEAGIVSAVSARLGAADRKLLSAHVAREHAADAARDHARMIRLSGDFHLLLARIAGNPMLEKFLRELLTRESLVIQVYEKPGRPSCSGHEHEAIVEALARKDEAQAIALMMSHLDAVEQRLELDIGPAQPVSLAAIFRAG